MPYLLVAEYPKELTILFPDSTFDFSPFEFSRKQFFPTHTTDNTSIDSAIYWLTTYEIDPVQRLSLPVFVIQRQDSSAVPADMDSLYLQELIKQVPDSVSAKELPLKTNTAYQRVSWIFNYPLAMAIIGITLLLIVVGWLVFSKQIKRYFKLRKLSRSHRQFLEKYQQASQHLAEAFTHALAERTLTIWKNYMENLVGEPYTRSTTRELRHIVTDKRLIETLTSIDVMVYSQSNGKDLNQFDELRRYAEDAFLKKQEEIKHG